MASLRTALLRTSARRLSSVCADSASARRACTFSAHRAKDRATAPRVSLATTELSSRCFSSSSLRLASQAPYHVSHAAATRRFANFAATRRSTPRRRLVSSTESAQEAKADAAALFCIFRTARVNASCIDRFSSIISSHDSHAPLTARFASLDATRCISALSLLASSIESCHVANADAVARFANLANVLAKLARIFRLSSTVDAHRSNALALARPWNRASTLPIRRLSSLRSRMASRHVSNEAPTTRPRILSTIRPKTRFRFAFSVKCTFQCVNIRRVMRPSKRPVSFCTNTRSLAPFFASARHPVKHADLLREANRPKCRCNNFSARFPSFLAPITSRHLDIARASDAFANLPTALRSAALRRLDSSVDSFHRANAIDLPRFISRPATL